MTNFYKDGRGLFFFKHLFRLFRTRNNRSRALFAFVLPILCFSIRSFSLMALICFMLFNLSDAWAQSAESRTAEGQKAVLVGEVLSSTDNKPIQGVSLRVNGISAITDNEGKFRIILTTKTGKVEVRHIGFQPESIDYDEKTTYLTISLEPLENQLEEVEVVSTGYQQLPKERATGSFVQIDNALLNRRVSTNIVERLDGMAPGILTNLKQKQRGQGDI